ncbi:MAG TPA: ABC transporter permease [Gemmatimonadaceae bacterium]|nr:ABC transporter permease [Gemmatimonadaceae bacterium]
MRKVLALVRASWLAAASYRLRSVMSLISLLVVVVPIYYISNAIQPIMGSKIATQGDQYFGFLLVGMMALSFLTASLNTLPSSLSAGIANGTLEAMLSTPTRVPTLLGGLMGYAFLWTTFRAIVLLSAGLAFGAHYAWGNVLPSALILVLIVLAHLPVGIIAGAFVLGFRAAGPLPQIVLVLSGLLGGVYYPTHVIPEEIKGIRQLADFMPLTYGLRALRRTLLEGWSLGDVSRDLGILLVFIAVLMAVSIYIFSYSLRYARRAGNLAQY